jgi:predicted NUDIX family phosphoesterase
LSGYILKRSIPVSEKVLVLQNNLLISHIQACSSCLITGHQNQVFNKILENHIFLPRDEAEYDFKHKQIIPYVVIRYDNDYLLLQRTTNQAEKRLHNKYSLGIGGHINPVSSISEENIIIESLYRELNEEVRVSEHGSLRFIGIINDDSNSVSKVHLGLFYMLEVLSPEFEVLEKDKMTGRWIGQETLKEYYEKFETWSQIVCDDYIFLQ